jgi:hypothetical protein
MAGGGVKQNHIFRVLSIPGMANMQIGDLIVSKDWRTVVLINGITPVATYYNYGFKTEYQLFYSPYEKDIKSDCKKLYMRLLDPDGNEERCNSYYQSIESIEKFQILEGYIKTYKKEKCYWFQQIREDKGYGFLMFSERKAFFKKHNLLHIQRQR